MNTEMLMTIAIIAVLLSLSVLLFYLTTQQRNNTRTMKQLIGNQQNFDICYGNLRTKRCVSMGCYPFAERWGLSVERDVDNFEMLSAICGYEVIDELRADMEHMKRTGERFVIHETKLRAPEEGKFFYCRRYVHRIGKHKLMCCILDVTEEVRQLEHMTHMASIDYLSSLMNRRAMSHVLNKRLQQVDEHDRAFLAMFDIDYFKKVNDSYGHDVGDQVLVAVADIIRATDGCNGRTARWGGEEYLLLLDAADVNEAKAKVEDIRARVKAHTIVIKGTDKSFRITVSAGLAELIPDEDYNVSIKNADKALYRAKQEGRDCLRVEL